jgi:hypothetical protein
VLILPKNMKKKFFEADASSEVKELNPLCLFRSG